jgi:putative membrane protein
MSEYRRQHPLLVLFDLGRGLLSYLSFAFIIAISLPGASTASIALNFTAALLALLALFALYNTIRWAFFFYRYEAGMVHIKQGILFKKERTIKRERVQSVNVYANILQQAFGLSTLQIKTAGAGTDAEVNLRALSRAEVENIREHLKVGERREEGAPMEVAKAARFLQGRDLWLAGLTSGRFMILFSLLAVVLSQVYSYIPQSYIDYALEQLSSVPLLLGIVLALGLLLVSWALSAVVFVIQYARFTIRRFEDRLEISWGVIKRNHVTVGLHRLQALVVQQGLFRQPFGLNALLVEVAGGGAKEKEQVSLLHPLIRTKDIAPFLEDILPEYRFPRTLVPLPWRSLRRYLFRALAPTALFVALIWWAVAFWDLPLPWTSLFLLLPAAWLGLSRHRNGRTSLDGDQLTLRFRDLNLYHVLMPRSHVQSLTLQTNPFQRFGGLRTVRAAVLSSPSGKEFRIKDVDREEAGRIWSWYSRSPPQEGGE